MAITVFWTLATLMFAPCVGSFVGVLTLRLPADRPWVAARSSCQACQRSLTLPDLIPIAAFLALRGRCRTCRAPIPSRYPLLELGCLLIAAWSALTQSGVLVMVTALLGWCLLAIAVIDAENLWLPDVLTLPLGLVGWLATVSLGMAPPFEPLVSAAIGYAILATIAFGYKAVRGRQGLGDGDPFLLAAIAAWVGWAALPSVLLWSCGAGLAVVAVRALGGRAPAASQFLPFGTFMAIGAWMTWLLGPLPIGS